MVENHTSYPFVNKLNCALLVTDYNSASIYECMISNTPIIIFFDRNKTPEFNMITKFYNIFEECEILYSSQKDASKAIVNIYSDIDNFWNSNKIQTVRKKFLDEYIFPSKTEKWDHVLIKTLENILKS